MRDAQSLLEQLLSFGGERLTVELVQRQLGIASDDRTLDLLDALSRRDPAEALKIVDATSMGGVQPTELLAGALDFLRDAMIIAFKADLPLLAASPRQKPRLKAIAERWRMPTLLAALQIFDETRRRLRGTSHGRTMVEIALMKVALLDDLGELGEVVTRLAALESGAPPVATVEKKKLTLAETISIPETKPSPGPSPAEIPFPETPPAREAPPRPPAWDLAAIRAAWPGWASTQPPELASKFGQLQVAAIPAPDVLVIEPIEGYNWVADACERPELRTKIETALRQWLDRPLEVRIVRQEATEGHAPTRQAEARARVDFLNDEPLIKLVVESFDARLIRVDAEEESAAPED